MSTDLSSLTEKEAIDSFNQILTQFIDECVVLFNNTNMANDLTFCQSGLKQLLNARLTAAIDQYIIHVYTKYSDLINEGNINKILSIDFASEGINVELSTILNVKNLMTSTSENNREIILQYLQLMNNLSTVYIKRKYGKK
jgi:hypothetical protein